MNAKLTLRMDEELIAKAKRHAQRTGKSVSAMVADYFDSFETSNSWESELHPRLQGLVGLAHGAELDEEDYWKYLEEKHR